MFVFIRYSKEVINKIYFRRLKKSALNYVALKWPSFRRALKPFTTEKDDEIVINFPYDDIDWVVMPYLTHNIPKEVEELLGINEENSAKKCKNKEKKKKVHKEGRLTEEEKAARRQERKDDRRINTLLMKSNLDFPLDNDIRRILRRGIKQAPVHEELSEKKRVNIRFISLDIGVKNFCTVCSNVFAPYLISGHTMIKALGYYDSMYNHADFGRYAITKKYSSSKKQKQLDKRNDILHEFIINVCDRIMQNVSDHNIDTIIFGYPDIWSKKTGLESKDMTVMFQRTLAKFKEMLRKRCSRHNIEFIELDEAFTSVCSFVDNEDICAKVEYCGKRVTRDKYYSKQGYSIHADVNASYNIAKKYLVNTGIWSDIYFTQMVAMLNNSRFISVLKQGYESAVAEELARKEELRHEGKRNMVRY